VGRQDRKEIEEENREAKGKGPKYPLLDDKTPESTLVVDDRRLAEY